MFRLLTRLAPFVLALVAPVSGCAGAQPVASTTPTVGSDARLGEAIARLDAQTDRIRELELRLALLESEARELRADVRAFREEVPAARGVVRIGAREVTAEDPPVRPGEEAATDRREDARVVLRLRSEARPAAVATLDPMRPAPILAEAARGGSPTLPTLPAVPPGVADRLAVAPLPGESLPAQPAAIPGIALPRAEPVAPVEPPEVAEYREALGLVRAERFDDALAALTRFLDRHPSHPYADNATYWRAEVHYARRDYPHALAEFGAVVTQWPRGNKAAEALLKIGLCHRRMGQHERAVQAFERVQREYPDSDAARVALREREGT